MNTSPSPPSRADNTGTSNDIDEILREFQRMVRFRESHKVERKPDNYMSLESTKVAIQNLIAQEATKARLDERKAIALDNYDGHTFSDSTDWRDKFDRFIKSNERRIKVLTADKEQAE